MLTLLENIASLVPSHILQHSLPRSHRKTLSLRLRRPALDTLGPKNPLGNSLYDLLHIEITYLVVC